MIIKNDMSTHNIIDSVISQSRSRDLVRQIIPILIRWAKLGLTDKTYNDINHALGFTRFSGIGHQLGNIDNVLKALAKETGEDIPTLNALCKNSSTHLPSTGFSYVYPNYDGMTKEEKQIFVAGLNQKAIEYKRWDWVLQELEVKPAITITDDELLKISKPIYGSGGEGKEHKALKEYIAFHPSSIGLSNVSAFDTEHILPSGDRLDVYFELKDGSRVAVEVKPSTSPDDDITRGIFQCVKYKAVMEAVRKVISGDYDVLTILVCGGLMSGQNKQLAEDLGVEYMDNFKSEK